MNAVIISPEFPPYTNWGGVATFNSNLATLLTSLGKNVEVFTLSTDKGTRTVTSDSYRIHYVGPPANLSFLGLLYLFIFKPFLYVTKKFFPSVSYLIEINVLFYFGFKRQNLRGDIVIHSPNNYSPGILTELLTGLPLVVHNQGPQKLLDKERPFTLDGFLLAQIEEVYCSKLATFVIACSRNVFNYLRDSISPEALIMIPNFLSMDNTKNFPMIHTNILLYIGRFEYRKGVDLVLRAFMHLWKENKQMTLWCIGQSERDDLDIAVELQNLKASKDMVDKIYILPAIQDKKGLQYIMRILGGIVVAPSRYEPFGYVYTEAMELGLPVIGGNHSGGKEIIEDMESGFLTECSVPELTRKIRYIRSLQKEELSAILKTARRRVKQSFSSSSVAKRYEELYEKIAAKRKKTKQW